MLDTDRPAVSINALSGGWDVAKTTDSAPGACDAVESPTQRFARSALFIATFVLIWISTSPFIDLGDAGLVGTTNDGNLVGQLATLALTGVMVIFIACHQPHMLTKAASPMLVLTLAWFALSAVGSDYPALALRRVILAALTIFQAAVFILLAPSRQDFARLLAIGALIVLALCYAGIVFLPAFSIHQFSDIREPELAGAWRGTFAHKNGAGAAMVLLIFVGLFAARAWRQGVGILIVVLASVFLVGTQAKSPLQLLPVVLVTIWLVGRLRHPALVAGLLLAAPAGILALTLGSVLYDPIQTLLESVMSDPTFTGRNVIWTFAIEHTAQRPIFGFGFQAFWGTSELVEAWNPQESWGYRASDAHNSFLDLSVMTGLVGVALASIWIVVQPMIDYLRSRSGPADPALTTLFMQFWFFGLCESALESIYFSGGSAIWFMVVVAIVGLRFQNSFHLCR